MSSPVESSPSGSVGLAQTVSLLREWPRLVPKKDRAETEQLLGPALSAAAYYERRNEIEAAARKLEEYRDEFAEIANDTKAHLDLARTLFAEEPFVPLWFTAADIRRAFDRVGYLSHTIDDPRTVETLKAALLFLADTGRRTELATKLMLQLPAYVAAGRHMDGWLIEQCACATMDAHTGSNPFLFEMFSHGFDAWQDEKRAEVQAVLRRTGVDPKHLDSMSVEEVEAWIQAQRADPAATARLEAIVKRDPSRNAQTIADLERMEEEAAKLLEREDARGLLLSREEVDPWVTALLGYLREAVEAESEPAGDRPPQGIDTEMLSKALWRVNDEMAKPVFTPERIQQLLAQLRKYRDGLIAAGDKRGAVCLTGSMLTLEREIDPAHNPLLSALSFLSLREAIGAVAESSQPNDLGEADRAGQETDGD